MENITSSSFHKKASSYNVYVIVTCHVQWKI
jgi:hypothetical protein